MDLRVEEFCFSARAWARRQASSYRVSPQHMDEIEESFVVSLLVKTVEPPLWTWPTIRRDPFLRRAARNFTINFLRSLTCEANAICTYLQRKSDAAGLLEVVADSQPELHLLRDQFWSQIASGLQSLRPGPREMFVRYHIQGAAFSDLGSSSGRTAHAIRQSLVTARQRLRSILAAQGNTESELRSYMLVQSVNIHAGQRRRAAPGQSGRVQGPLR